MAVTLLKIGAKETTKTLNLGNKILNSWGGSDFLLNVSFVVLIMDNKSH